jgi:hypothetical protein
MKFFHLAKVFDGHFIAGLCSSLQMQQKAAPRLPEYVQLHQRHLPNSWHE